MPEDKKEPVIKRTGVRIPVGVSETELVSVSEVMRSTSWSLSVRPLPSFRWKALVPIQSGNTNPNISADHKELQQLFEIRLPDGGGYSEWRNVPTVPSDTPDRD